MFKKFRPVLPALLLVLALVSCGPLSDPPELVQPSVTLSDLPKYSGDAYIEVNGNIPYFEDTELTTTPFESYSPLDELGRCGAAFANICKELMPTEERGEIGMIKPSGWHTVRYDDVVNGKYLYNRCHLIGYQLAGENANEKNLITGTRYLNIEGMLPFENKVDDYVDKTGNHVLYRVTPIFREDNLLADGVLIEACSVEDKGAGVRFCVFCYNIQPGITIDYATGDSCLEGDVLGGTVSQREYVLNTSSMKFHDPACGSVSKISAGNYQTYSGTRAALIKEGYSPCGVCKP